MPPERFGQRQTEEDVDEGTTTKAGKTGSLKCDLATLLDRFLSASSLNLPENNAYLNGTIKRKRPEAEEPTPKLLTKEERVRLRNRPLLSSAKV